MLTAEEEKTARIKVRRNLMWLGIISIFMLFAGLTSAYVVAMGKPGFVPLEIPFMFWISGGIIAASSLFMILAYRSAKSDRNWGVVLGLFITLILGIAFTVTQYLGWSDLISRKIFFAEHPSGQYLYLLSGLHLLHLGAGLFSLVFCLIRSFLGKYNALQLIGLEVAGMYWHFLGILWIYLLLFLHFVR